jgi:hypothetical protein
MVAIVKKLDQMIKDLEREWAKAIKDIDKSEEYTRSTIVRFAEVHMKRLIRRALDIDPAEFEMNFESGSPETFFDLGAEHFKKQLIHAFLEEGRSVNVESIWQRFQEKRERGLMNAMDYVGFQGADELEPLRRYMYFSSGLRSILDTSQEIISELPSFDIQERVDGMISRVRQMEKGLSTMDKDLHGDRDLLNRFNFEIKNMQERIHKIGKDANQMAAEINGKVDKEMLPRIGGLEKQIRDIEKKIDGIRKRAENVENAKDVAEKLIENLEEKYNKDLQRLHKLAERFLNSDDKFLVVHKEIFRNLGENEEALLGSLELSTKNYKIEDANVSERIDLAIAEVEQKIKSASQYNSIILQFWIEVLKYTYRESLLITEKNGEFESPVDIRWQKGIEALLNSLDEIFEDKDALMAMKIVSNYDAPLFDDGREIWDRYRTTDHETRKRLYERMRSDSLSPAYLKIGIPVILSRAVMNIAKQPWYHRDLSEFIWFCSVVYDETWKRYGDLLDEMIRRMQR